MSRYDMQQITSSRPAPSATCLRVQVLHWTDWAQVAQLWSGLVKGCSNPEFFVDTPWVGSWIETYGPALRDVSILLFYNEADLVGACLLVRSTPKVAMVPVRRLSVNTSGEDINDAAYVEFNNLLCRDGWHGAVAYAAAKYILSLPWDEILVDGFVPGSAYDALVAAFDGTVLEEIRRPSYYIDLRAIRDSRDDFDATLGRSYRKHLRQNIRHYTAIGEIRLDVASDYESAVRMLDALGELSRNRWQDRNRNVVFASPLFTAFHRTLIGKCMPTKSVQLMHLTAGDQTIGYVYNFVLGDVVYFYQCGFNYSPDPRRSPGTVAMAYAVRYCIEQGFNTYELLSGGMDYKAHFATGTRPVVWATFRRRSIKTQALMFARDGKHWFMNQISRRVSPPRPASRLTHE